MPKGKGYPGTRNKSTKKSKSKAVFKAAKKRNK